MHVLITCLQNYSHLPASWRNTNYLGMALAADRRGLLNLGLKEFITWIYIFKDCQDTLMEVETITLTGIMYLCKTICTELYFKIPDLDNTLSGSSQNTKIYVLIVLVPH